MILVRLRCPTCGSVAGTVEDHDGELRFLHRAGYEHPRNEISAHDFERDGVDIELGEFGDVAAWCARHGALLGDVANLQRVAKLARTKHTTKNAVAQRP